MVKRGALAKKRTLRKNLKKITEGLFSATTDFILFSLYLPVASLGKKRTAGGVAQTFEEAQQLLEELNYQKIKRALSYLKKQGLIETAKNNLLEANITAAGKKRLTSLLPVYDEKRTWDKRLYLINYDISVKQNLKRAIFRHLLKKIGAIKLQDSLYLTPYNPSKIINEFIEGHNLEGEVLVSTLGKEGFLEKKNLSQFLWEASGLEKINNRYREFLKKYKEKKSFPKTQVAFDYYSILRDDPQLPFELLPEDYLGDEAYLLFLKLTKA